MSFRCLLKTFFLLCGSMGWPRGWSPTLGLLCNVLSIVDTGRWGQVSIVANVPCSCNELSFGQERGAPMRDRAAGVAMGLRSDGTARLCYEPLRRSPHLPQNTFLVGGFSWPHLSHFHVTLPGLLKLCNDIH